MRITGGAFGGRVLAAPSDARVRPTADKVRQAIFNVLNHNDFGIGFSLQGARVADLFAGTGALGIEALSHGASYALLVDDSAESRALIRENVETLGLTGITKIWRRDATKLGPLPAGAGGAFDLVFLDPPYREGLLGKALESLAGENWLAPNALIVAESARDEEDTLADAFVVLADRLYGDTRVRFLSFSPAPDPR